MGNVRIGVRWSGRRSASPNRPSNSDAPTPTVTVSESEGTVGPTMPLSDGGAVLPRSTGTPPAVRNRARSVMVRSSSARPARSGAITSKDANIAAVGGGVTIPA